MSECSEQEKAVLEFLYENDSVKSKQVEDLLNIKESRTRELLLVMVDKGFVIKQGQGRSTSYTLLDSWLGPPT